MDDEKKPFQDIKQQSAPDLSPLSQTPIITPPQQPLPDANPEQPLQVGRGRWNLHRFRILLIGGVILLVLLAIGAALVWYGLSLRPVAPQDTSRVRIEIASGTSPSVIGETLQQKKIIRNALVFEIYTRLHGVRNKLQAGTYSLSPSESTADVVGHLISGKTDTFTIMFYPGATLTDTTADGDCQRKPKTDVEDVLLCAGYSKTEVMAALAGTYDNPLFAGKPAAAGLEGYVYGETYQFSSGATAREILQRTFDEFYTQIEQHDIIAGLQKQGLNLYQGLILASIIQREVSSADPSTASSDQKQVAQVFYSRLAQGIPLGSDVTAYYGADKIGVPRSVAVDTPYNTRIHTGLPPGPIAVPSIGALEAAANPASGDYLYFLSGDDGKTYFAHTEAEHEQNITTYCQVKCQAS